jgi:hypothetical protein
MNPVPKIAILICVIAFSILCAALETAINFKQVVGRIGDHEADEGEVMECVLNAVLCRRISFGFSHLALIDIGQLNAFHDDFLHLTGSLTSL